MCFGDALLMFYSLWFFKDILAERGVNIILKSCLVNTYVWYIVQGELDEEGLQVYAFSLWQLGENDLALSVARSLAASLSSMDKSSVATSICFICRLVYFICGLDAVVTSIVKMPMELFQSSKVSFVMSAINILDGQNRLGLVVSNTRHFLKYQEEIARMHFLIALGKLVFFQPLNFDSSCLLH